MESMEYIRLQEFCCYLKEEERSRATIEKYHRDVKKFLKYVEASCETMDQMEKAVVVEYKEMLIQEYEASSVNSMLAAVNRFLEFVGKEHCRVKRIKIQHKPFIEESIYLSKDDVRKLFQTAKIQGKHRLETVMKTLCFTGIRVSELAYITVEHLKSGVIRIFNKGKVRMIGITGDFRRHLLDYAKSQQIISGPIFITKSGNCLDRSNLWREIKRICLDAGIPLTKGFPHNFRHLFARCYYEIDKDIVNLADILGHGSIETTRIYTKTTYMNLMKKLDHMSTIFQV